MSRALATLIGLWMVIGLPAAAEEVSAAAHKYLEIDRRQDIRAAYDIKVDVQEAGIGKALYYARGLLEAYKSMGVKPRALRVSLVLHGSAAYWLLNDEAYQGHAGDPFAHNPNGQVVEQLLDHGVSVEMCRATMRGHGWRPEDLLPGVTIVHDAYTRLIDLQQQGYGYIRF